jgi:hypothetical protein
MGMIEISDRVQEYCIYLRTLFQSTSSKREHVGRCWRGLREWVWEGGGQLSQADTGAEGATAQPVVAHSHSHLGPVRSAHRSSASLDKIDIAAKNPSAASASL